ncbi:hypothetical protein V8C86DRAFT_2707453 [Haematococcus lacustris]
MSKAERRELQESQRAAKAASKAQQEGGPAHPAPAKAGQQSKAGSKDRGSALQAHHSLPSRGSDDKGAPHPPTSSSVSPSGAGGGASQAAGEGAGAPGSGAGAVAKPKKQQGAKVVSLNSTELFAHLPQYKQVSVPTLLAHRDAGSMHPAVLQLGLRYADGTIQGASARCMALLHTLCQLIQDYSTPDGKSLSRDMTQQLNAVIAFLVDCRPLSVSMGNAIKLLKLRLSQIDPSTPEAEAKASLIAHISDFISTRIVAADRELAKLANKKVDDGDVILTFAASYIVSTALCEAARAGKRFRVVVVDSRPEQEGRLTLQKLQAAGIACTYAHFNALSYVIRDVTKVFLGAAAVMSNGTVMGRAGNAAVAMMAVAHSKPVLVCCESFKFHERVQLDSITHNELGDPGALAAVAGRPDVTALREWQDKPRLGLLNLKYDAMPAEYVTMIVTEFGMIPPTSVPVILREYQQYGREMGT